MEKNPATDHAEYMNGFGTKAIHVGNEPDPQTNAVTVPIYPTSSFVVKDRAQKYFYSRASNPTRSALETNLAALEQAQLCVTASSGMAACSLIMHVFNVGDSILCSENVHPDVRKYMEKMARSSEGLKVEFADLNNLELVKEKVKSGVKGVWVESPGGAILEVFNIPELAKICSESKALLIVDNTVLSPYLQNPLKLGAAMVIHSCTNSINGHNDTLMGAVMTNEEAIYKGLKRGSMYMGCFPSPFDCYLVLRGTKTLGPRMDESEEISNALAKILSTHEKIEECIYPGLSSHKGHELLKRQAKGFGANIAVRVKGGEEAAKKLCKELKVFTRTVGGGCVESMAYIPATTIYKEMSEEEHKKVGVTKNLVMLSIGNEDLEDLKNDLIQALNKI
eukprot:TRINITY_DN10077_c0_g4_i4.p1 TRINITY_DN10077_c0_g4~~TRINITY_DN10077_c0_g4_i4.p1  ORF type:complete len:393 (-),score=87.69 TRINITY_DN10077_c0_g4_i4:141-1319(-)